MTEIKKRGRGRPKKEVVAKEKRPRGRPKKVVTEVKEKRPRGRPKKEVVTNEIKRPRGRPRKIENEMEKTILEENSQKIEQNVAKNDGLERVIKNVNAPLAKSLDDEDLAENASTAKGALLKKASKKCNSKTVPAKHLKQKDLVDKPQEAQEISLNPPQQETRPNVSKSYTPVVEQQAKETKPLRKTTFLSSCKVVVITGATSGMGLAMAKQFVALGQVVIGVGRRPSVCRDARNEILDEYPGAQIHYLVADLSLMSQVRILADEIKAKVLELGRDSVDVLIHNAGVFTNMHKITYENNEVMWATNYLAPFLLTKELQPLLDRSKDARVITITNSKTHKTTLDWEDIRGVTGKSNEKVYNQTKLADLMFALEYDHRNSSRDDLHAYCVDPGFVNTDLRTKSMSGFRRWVLERWRKKGKTIEQGIETTIYLALAENLPKNVVFYSNKKPTEPCKYALDPRNRSALWRYTEIGLLN